MFIYIDESGIFANPQGKPSTVSCVAAVVLPESARSAMQARFPELIAGLGDVEELKGAKLSEDEIERVLRFLEDLGAFAEISAIDMGLHRSQEIEEHQKAQAEWLIADIAPRVKPPLLQHFQSLRNRLLALSPNLYVQASLMVALVNRVLRTSTLFFARRTPEELGAFRWSIDAKSSAYEDLWMQIVLPALQSRFLEEPLVRLEDGDYSHFDRFSNVHQRAASLDVRKLVHESCSFVDSRREPGLQLADVVATAYRRSVRGHLQKSGWKNLGKLLVKWQGAAVQMITLKSSRDQHTAVRVPYSHVMEHLNKTARTID